MAGKGDRYRPVKRDEYEYRWKVVYDKCKVCLNDCKQPEHSRTRACKDFKEVGYENYKKGDNNE